MSYNQFYVVPKIVFVVEHAYGDEEAGDGNCGPVGEFDNKSVAITVATALTNASVLATYGGVKNVADVAMQAKKLVDELAC